MGQLIGARLDGDEVARQPAAGLENVAEVSLANLGQDLVI